MQRILSVLSLLALFILQSNLSWAKTDRYRLTLRDNPSTSIVIGWDQISGNAPVVYYGEEDQDQQWTMYPHRKEPDRIVDYKDMNNHFARLTQLKPNTKYFFVIKDSEGTSKRYWFKTCPNDATTRLSFIAGGDSRNNMEPRKNANLLVSKLKPNAVFFGGDMTSSGSSSQWIDWFDHWQLTISEDGQMFPVVAARGNHESSNKMIHNLFDTPNKEIHYAVTFGNDLVRAYTLNTESSIAGNQTQWLAEDLNKATSTWKIAQYHKPMRPHVKGKSEGDEQYSKWSPLFYKHNVSLVVECDAHTVKTTWPIKPSKGNRKEEGFVRDDYHGTVYVGEGCWGAPLRNNDDNKSWTRNSGKFNQFKWIFADQNTIEVRTIKVDNAQEVEPVPNDNPFVIPPKLEVWNPSNGNVVTIQKQKNGLVCELLSPFMSQLHEYPQPITIKANAASNNSNVEQIEISINDVILSKENTASIEYNWTPPKKGIYEIKAIATDNLGKKTVSSTSIHAVGLRLKNTLSQVKTENDDAEEGLNTGIMYLNSSDLELGKDNYMGDQLIGLRFLWVKGS